MRFSDDCPSAPTLPTRIVIVASTADRRSPAGLGVDQRNVEEAQENPERGDLGGDAMNAVTGVARPHRRRGSTGETAPPTP